MENRAVISVVDDDDAFRGAIRRLIESADLAVDDYASAEAFLISDRTRNARCLILDVGLPGMSGLELHTRLVASGRRIPTIFISALCDERTRARALGGGAVDFLLKPFGGDALLRAVDMCLGDRGTGAGPVIATEATSTRRRQSAKP